MKHTEPEFRDCWMKYALVLTTVPQADHLCKLEKELQLNNLNFGQRYHKD